MSAAHTEACPIHDGELYECSHEHTDGKRYRHCTGSSIHNVEIRVRPGDLCDATCTTDCGHCKGTGQVAR